MSSFIEQYKILHKEDLTYGTTGEVFYREACLFIDFLKPKVVLDYGCGKSTLIQKLALDYPDIEFYGYDPAIEEKDVLLIQKADLVICSDVLEHIPQEELSGVIEKISQISKNCFFVLHHYPAEQILLNGENAHCTVKPPSWYHNLFEPYFKDIIALKARNPFNGVVVTFKLLPEWIKKYNFIIEKPDRFDELLCYFENELNEVKKIFKFFHKKDIKAKLFKYRFLRLISFGNKKKHYIQKVKELKMIKKLYFN